MNAPASSPWNAPQAKLDRDEPGGPLYAGFWRRFAAYWLDFLLVYILMLVVGVVMGLVGAAAGARGAGALAAPFASLAVVWLYFALMHSSARQATFGKMAFGIKVTDLEGERIGFLRATGRYFATWISSILLAIGFLMAGFTARKQGLHDLMAGTLVVRADAGPQSVQAGGTTMPVGVGVILVAFLLGPVPVVGILAAIAIPAYQDYLTRAQLVESVMEARNARTAIETHYAQKRELPAKLSDTGYRPSSPHVSRVEATLTGPTLEVRAVPVPTVRVSSTGGAVLMRSPAPPAAFEWKCSGYNIPNKYLPANCRE